MFGDNILVAPVESTRLTEDVYLPKGEWYRLSTGAKYKGGKSIKADAPLTDLPVFVKAGAIIPMQNVIQSTNEKGDGILKIHVWNGRDSTSFVYYEDDGESYDYQNGEYYKRTISFNPKNKQIILADSDGTYPSKYNKIEIILHGFKTDPKNFKVNGVAAKLSPFIKDGSSYSIFPNDGKAIIVEY
jgi:alpha-glucosidase